VVVAAVPGAKRRVPPLWLIEPVISSGLAKLTVPVPDFASVLAARIPLPVKV
jgi:hypothetical protein